jgi:hypothetical protein
VGIVWAPKEKIWVSLPGQSLTRGMYPTHIMSVGFRDSRARRNLPTVQAHQIAKVPGPCQVQACYAMD